MKDHRPGKRNDWLELIDLGGEEDISAAGVARSSRHAAGQGRKNSRTPWIPSAQDGVHHAEPPARPRSARFSTLWELTESSRR